MYGEKPTPKMYEKLTDTLQALNTLWLAAGGDQEKIAKMTSHEAVQELIERIYPLYERNADRVTRNQQRAAFAAIAVPQTVAADERSQIAYRDIAGIPPTITSAEGKSVQVSPAKWAEGIDILRRTGQVENFNKAFGVDSGAYILKTLPYHEAPAGAPTQGTAPVAEGPGMFTGLFSRLFPPATGTAAVVKEGVAGFIHPKPATQPPSPIASGE